MQTSVFSEYRGPDGNISGKQCLDSEKQEYDHTEHDPVISEYFKVVILDIFQQELDRDDRHDKGNRHPDNKDRRLHAGKIKTEFQQFQCARPKHDRYGEEKGELCRRASGDSQHERPYYRCA